MTLTLTAELEAEIQQQMDSGRFHSPVEVLQTAMGALRDATPDEDPHVFDAKLQEGLNDIERGDTFSEVEARAYLAELRAKL